MVDPRSDGCSEPLQLIGGNRFNCGECLLFLILDTRDIVYEDLRMLLCAIVNTV